VISRGFRRAPLHTLAGAYALDALGDADGARFERHLARCEVCAQEVRGLRETAALLGSAAAAAPPQRMRAHVLAAAGQTRQHPPARTAAEHVPQHSLRPWLRRPRAAAALAVAAAALAGVVALGLVTLGTQHRLDRAEERNRQVAAVLTARDAVLMTAPVRTGGTATVVMSHAKRMIVFSARGLRSLGGSRSYELWLIGPEGVRAAGMLPALGNGTAPPMVASGVGAGDKVGMTVEPAQGSNRPTTPPVLMLSLTD
jgi:anti-sigma-K factor RskA